MGVIKNNVLHGLFMFKSGVRERCREHLSRTFLTSLIFSVLFGKWLIYGNRSLDSYHQNCTNRLSGSESALCKDPTGVVWYCVTVEPAVQRFMKGSVLKYYLPLCVLLCQTAFYEANYWVGDTELDTWCLSCAYRFRCLLSSTKLTSNSYICILNISPLQLKGNEQSARVTINNSRWELTRVTSFQLIPLRC